MKVKHAFLLLKVVIALQSCKPFYYYQIIKVSPSQEITKSDNSLIYEDNTCMISYNLWSSGGDAGFLFYNKSEQNVYVDLSESFFILNGVADNYYKDRIYTYSFSTGVSNSRTSNSSVAVTGLNYQDLIQTNRVARAETKALNTSSSQSVSRNEEKIVCIPPKASKLIGEYKINSVVISDCDLLKYPTQRQVKSKAYNIENSPIVFSNRITYKLGDSTEYMRIENKFYISQISNYPEAEVFDWDYRTKCNQESMTRYKTNKFNSSDAFYIKYAKGNDIWKH